jgi:endonuclease G, mitochondrial
MKKSLLFLVLLLANINMVFAQGLIIHKHTGLKDTVVISSVDSITFSQSIIVHKNIGTKDSVLLSNIDSLTVDASIIPSPIISSLDPLGVEIGSPEFTLTVKGINFFNSSVVKWNSSALITQYISPTELHATVPASDLTDSGNVNITVFTPAPGGGISPNVIFGVGTAMVIMEDFETGTKGSYAAGNVTISTGVWNLSDALIGNSTADVRNGNAVSRIRNSGKLTMQFDFTTGASTVSVLHAMYGTDAPTKWELWYSTDYGNNWNQSGTTITTNTKVFQKADFKFNIVGLVRFEIRKTDGASARLNIDDIKFSTYGVTNSGLLPVLTSISPTADTVGAPNLTITALGSNFISSSSVLWNGTKLSTTFISATELHAAVPPSFITGTGTVKIGVFTPNGGYSSTINFTINPGFNGFVPVFRYISPQICTYGRAGFTLMVTGSNFSASSIVKWNDVLLTTTYLSGTQLTAQVTAALVDSIGTANVSVYTPSPGGTSSSGIFTINTGPLPSSNINLTMGNPSNAVNDTTYPLNYLVERGQYCMSYSRDRNLCNWISWELDTTWLGTASRGNFLTDNTLPAGWPRVSTNDYSGSGFNRGHMCPSADRTRSIADNDTVFLMSNIIPQAGPQNGGPWGSLEVVCRDLALQGNKVYIYCGSVGEGGVGDYGYATSISNGKVVVPSRTWKVAMVLPPGTNDVSRVDTTTRCIAVILENNQGPFNDWKTYRVSVDSVEALTGYDFFPNVPVNIQTVIESKIDNQ